VLFNDSGEVVDARCLREGEEMSDMISVDFPCHSARIRCRIEPYHLMMASMPQMEMMRTPANWWLFRSPAEADVLKFSDGQFQKPSVIGSSVVVAIGPAQPEKDGDKKGGYRFMFPKP
jgi:hypothetical protein